VWTLDGFGVAERSDEVEPVSVEVERLVLGPQPADHRARLGQARHRLVGLVERQAVRLVLAPGQGVVGSRAHADAEVQPAARDDVDGRRDLGQERGWADAVAGYE
jgi:hypothetical protein